ncbi:Actin-like protein ARP9 [Wickerhamiella sorbophila]|uniref:Actin-like protein ARP9 n=1 Tax=Wickerhamiella sorbophila TaxID=45607 RepID=A0A2T0FMG2_9ASCO|nr:Actin-like protein ARP9 [Wickerhamiella sorbophila]PRT56157.1 Actin-like protein ARP9 [Wickerhamiella sorbophila]
MSLVFRDHQILVISPGSLTTQAQMGLAESLVPALLETQTKVYRDGSRFATTGSEDQAVWPLKQGEIADEAAFHFFLKSVYKSAVRADAVLPPALYLVSSVAWNRRQLEGLTRYLFEEVGVPALSVCMSGVTNAYAYATANALVIDVGFEKTEISAVVDSEVNLHASRIAPLGGNSINTRLSQLLPDLSETQVEDLKLSGIVETLLGDTTLAEQAEAEVRGKGEEDEGVIDVAAIVSSGRTREILEQRERELKGQVPEKKANADLDQNTFTDRDGVEHTVGRERFNIGHKLIASIIDTVALVHADLKPRAQQQAWEHVIITGRGSAVPGFKVKLLARLEEEFLVSRPPLMPEPIPNDAATMGRQTPSDSDYLTQVPTTIRLAKMADHFPEWKPKGWDTAGFLGAQIGAKQTFTSGFENLFLSRQDYNEVGPSAAADY